ncbi:hypothetical protein BC1002_6530 [Paraburkholderia atlantica]|uniref:Uncharacterized protein n=1 Tax=Paraburkholderia atlantica TaxID=2654982 RepID=D5WMC5_PARAM|nr:hypothetical protein BC1002_6530 [Paraburkholderia atlantica]
MRYSSFMKSRANCRAARSHLLLSFAEQATSPVSMSCLTAFTAAAFSCTCHENATPTVAIAARAQMMRMVKPCEVSPNCISVPSGNNFKGTRQIFATPMKAVV